MQNNGKEHGSYYSILGLYRESGNGNGNYQTILGLYRDSGKENASYHSILGLYRDNGKEMETTIVHYGSSSVGQRVLLHWI